MSKKDKESYEQYYDTDESTPIINDMDNNQSYDKYQHNKNCHKQRHTHEFLGSTKLAELEEDPHNHRFAGVTGEAIPHGRSHFHKLETNTDFVDHFHEIIDRTSLAIPVGNGKHVHLVKGMTTENDGHRHNYIFATLIESPLV